tara:strand:- start:321 stop:794 length:474 start_codon:yes stop_codon:yes gene_type:complete
MKEQVSFSNEMKIPHAVQVENGDMVKMFPCEKPYIYDKAPSGRLCVDGDISIEEDSTFIKERKNLANNGYIDLTLIISSKGSLLKKPLINIKGLPIFERDEYFDGLEDEIIQLTKTFSLKNIKQNQNLIDGLKKTCRKYTKERTGKKPITNINVIRI